MSVVLDIAGLRLGFRTPAGLLRAVDGVSLHVREGETLGLVGESGCGKSSLARCVVGLHAPTAGTVSIAGGTPTSSRLERARLVQMVFQDPASSLNPRKTVGTIVAEPLSVHGIGARAERRGRVSELLRQVGLGEHHAERYPHELSGGQRQRVSIARALALEPRLLVCDEPVSALDVSVQAQILNLFLDIQKRMGLAYLFISHDLAVIRYVSNCIAVMYLGRIVETGDTESVWRRRFHPYTRGLIEAIPGEAGAGRAVVFEGDVPSPVDPPSGCAFRTRCPFARERCAREVPAPRALLPGHLVACHFADNASVVPPFEPAEAP